MTEEKVIDRVKKLLAKAHDSAVTLEEAETFAAKAAELLEKYKLSMSDVEFAAQAETDPVKDWYVDPTDLGMKRKKSRDAVHERLATVVAQAHMCDTVVIPGSNAFYVVGRKMDAEIAIFMFHYLAATLDIMSTREYAAYFRKCQRQGDVTRARGFRESYRLGFVSSIARRYREREEERRRVDGKGVALVRIGAERAAVQDFMKQEMKTKKTAMARGRGASHGEGVIAGAHAGNAVDLDRRGVRGGSGPSRQLEA